MKGIYFTPDIWKSLQQVLDQYGEAQTRRVIKPQPDDDGGLTACFSVFDHNITELARYQVGETVYIKEAFMFKKGADIRESYIGTPDEGCLGFPPHYLYKADDTEEVRDYGRCYKWRSPMMMPEWAARHFLTITGVRAERVQEITPADCQAEGIDVFGGWKLSRHKFMELWNSINKDYRWESNLWVFAYTFRQEIPQICNGS